MLTPHQKNKIKEITSRFKPSLVGVFGSYARDEHTLNSDLDILIDFKSKVNLLDLIGLEQELSDSLGIRVDLVTINSVSEHIKPYIQKDLIRII
ncbi:nucleotidyltransferase family protein [Telluribacter sp.]|uniref:nucleotidyltransferase family protein n=1 Tax=Telluribacter sp. TaxID=1978767 RepID=UPI002E13690F|nr:nucleotidyltransferase family protein [Telluribacter sp.]